MEEAEPEKVYALLFEVVSRKKKKKGEEGGKAKTPSTSSPTTRD